MELIIFVAVLAIFAFAAMRWGAEDREDDRGRHGAGGILSKPGNDRGWRVY